MSQESVSGIDLINLTAAILSIVLAVVALWLSLFFFRASTRQAEQAQKTMDSVVPMVAKIEKLFDTLYQDTFAMMRETVSDMRGHIWSQVEREFPQNVDEATTRHVERQLQDTKDQLLTLIAESTRNLGIDDQAVHDLEARVEPALHRALRASSDVGAEFGARNAFVVATIRSFIDGLDSRTNAISYGRLNNEMQKFGFAQKDIEQAVNTARDEGWIRFDPDSRLDTSLQLSLNREAT